MEKWKRNSSEYYWEYVLNLDEAEKDLKTKSKKTINWALNGHKSFAKINLSLLINRKLKMVYVIFNLYFA